MNRPTLLIGGGYDKESSYEEWIRAFDGKVRYLVLIGQTKEKIEKAAHSCGFMSTILAEDLEEALKSVRRRQITETRSFSHRPAQAGASLTTMSRGAISSKNT